MFGIAQITVIPVRATRQRHGLIAFRTAVIARRQAKAGIAGIAPVARRTLRQAVVIINRVARRTAWPLIAAATGIANVAAGFLFQLAGLRN